MSDSSRKPESGSLERYSEMAGIIIVVILFIIGGIYFFVTQLKMNQAPAPVGAEPVSS